MREGVVERDAKRETETDGDRRIDSVKEEGGRIRNRGKK